MFRLQLPICFLDGQYLSLLAIGVAYIARLISLFPYHSLFAVLLPLDSIFHLFIIIIIIVYLLQLGLHPVAVVLTLHNYNKKKNIQYQQQKTYNKNKYIP
jgi:hypothetical protein